MNSSFAKTLFALCLCAVLAGWHQNAYAHAIPVTYQYAHNTNEQTFSITFSENIENAGSGITLFKENEKITTTNTRIQNNTIRITIADPAQPTRAQWYVTSRDDGHFTRGGYLFENAQSTTISQPQTTVSHAASLVEAASIWGELIGSSLLLGIYALWVLTKQQIALLPKNTQEKWGVTLRMWAIGSSTITTTAIAALLAYKAILLQNASGATTLLQSLHTVLQTTSGQSTLTRGLLFALCIVSTLCIPSKKIATLLRITTPLTIAALVLRSVASHAFASGFYPIPSAGITALHLFSKELWIGTILALVFLLPRILKNLDVQFQTLLIKNINKLTSVCLGIGGATGAYIVWLDLKDFQNLFVTSWGRECITLTVTALLLLAVRVYNQYSPKLEAPRTTRILQQGFLLPLEAALGAAVLAATALIIITSPPQHAQTIALTKNNITVQPHPFRTNQLQITTPKNSTQVEASIVDPTDIQNTTPLPLTHVAPNTFITPLSAFSSTERTTLRIVAHAPSAYDTIATFTIPTTITNPTPKFSPTLPFLCGVAALLLVGLSMFLFKTAGGNAPPQLEALLTEQAWFFWIIVVGILSYSLLGTHAGHSGLIKSAFERTCTKDGYTWQEAVPTYETIPSGTDLFLGCSGTKNGKTFHIPKYDEYLYSIESKERRI